MATRTLNPPPYVEQLSSALRGLLSGADVTAEQVRKDHYRFVVVWPGFDRLGHPERQNRVWSLAQKTLSDADLLKVSMILTLGLKDVAVTAR